MAHVITGRKSGFIVRGGRSVRQMVWLDNTFQNTNITAASTAVILTSLDAAALAARPFTVIRTRGWMDLASDQTANTEDQIVIYGEIVAKDEAVAVGVTAVPTPVAQSNSDWHVFEPLSWGLRVADATGLLNGGVGRSFDSKAMRKVDLGDDLIQVVETAAASEGILFRVFSRALVKLH